MSHGHHIVVVDDMDDIRSILRRSLAAEGYAVSEADSIASLMRRLDAAPASLIALDRRMEGGDSLDVVCTIRQRHNIPVIMVTGLPPPDDAASGVELGVDGYIMKPFGIDDLLTMVRDVLGRYGPLEAASGGGGGTPRIVGYRLEAGTLDLVRGQLRRPNGDQVELAQAERDLLAILLQHPRRVLSRAEILQLLARHGAILSDPMLDSHIARLRNKVEDAAAETPRLIRSVRGVGYVLAGDVVRLEGGQVSSA